MYSINEVIKKKYILLELKELKEILKLNQIERNMFC